MANKTLTPEEAQAFISKVSWDFENLAKSFGKSTDVWERFGKEASEQPPENEPDQYGSW